MLDKYLKDLESRINPEAEEDIYTKWKKFCDGEQNFEIFSPRRNTKKPPQIKWPDISINSALEDYESMALHQLKECSDIIAEGSGRLLTVRCNYGTGILSSIFGSELFIMDEELETLPTTKPIISDEDDIVELLEKGIPDLNHGLGGRVFKMAEKYKEIMEDYPKINQFVHIYHPDLQGPMDICELLLGSNLFTALIDNPELIKKLLQLITDTYLAFMQKWQEYVPCHKEYAFHWSMLHKGNIMLRDDSAMNLSPEMFGEFIRPYDQKLLSRFGGGAIHFCGKGDHFISNMTQMDGLYAINLSQPEYNDMEIIYKNTVDKGLKLIGLERKVAEKALEDGRSLNNCVHCW